MRIVGCIMIVASSTDLPISCSAACCSAEFISSNPSGRVIDHPIVMNIIDVMNLASRNIPIIANRSNHAGNLLAPVAFVVGVGALSCVVVSPSFEGFNCSVISFDSMLFIILILLFVYPLFEVTR